MIVPVAADLKRVRALPETAGSGPLSRRERARVRAGGRGETSACAMFAFPRPLPLSRERARRALSKNALVGSSQGFTLLEVLVASLLMTLVLTTLWETFHVYSRLFERGGIQARQARLVAALQRQFADDLQSAIEDSPRPNDASSVSSVRRFGLLGSADMLRFDVLQMLPDDQLPSSEDSPSLGRASTSKSQVPELKTVVYRFVPRRHSSGASSREDTTERATEASQDEAFLPDPGLTRWEIDFETPLETTAGRAVPMKEPTGDADLPSPARGTAGGASFEDLAAQAAAPEAITWLPEVRRATFQYFDGRTWSDSWNSIQRGSLPVAVEVTLRIRDLDETRRRPRPKEEPDAAPAETEDSADETRSGDNQPAQPFDPSGLSAGARQPAYRFLIRLPVAQHHPELQAARSSSLGTEASAEEHLPMAPADQGTSAVPSPALFPPPSSPAGPTEHPDSFLPDQWLRTVP